MEQEYLFTNLPQEIAIDIFSRLPLPTIINCRCVCKRWRHLLSTPEFAGYHYSKSLPGLILSKESAGESSERYKILEFVDSGRHLPCETVYRFSAPLSATLESSANGLLLLVNYENRNAFVNYENRKLLVCNPLTREYIILPPPIESHPFRYHYYGFGVTKASGEYKVVWNCPLYKFEVYTLGTGSWRNVVVPAGGAGLPRRHPCVFVDGNLYNWVEDSCMSCFDLETEVFSPVSCPSSRDYKRLGRPHLCALEGRLCLCLNDLDEVVIWLMDEVGHWTKEFVICKAQMHDRYRFNSFKAIKILGGGEMLLATKGIGELYYYSRKRKRETIKPISVTKNSRSFYRIGYTPSFLSLKTFAILRP